MPRLKLIRVFFAILLCISFGGANARLNIEINQGMVAGVPIAVTNSAEETALRRSGYGAAFEELAGVVRNDLRMSGRFEPLFPEQLPRVNNVQQELDAGLWQQARVENVVLGTVKPEAGDRFAVSFKLLDVYKAQSGASGQLNNGELTRVENTVLLSKTYHGISRKDFRALAHRISDDIYEKLTGIRGAFSTRIAYVMVVRAFDGSHYSLEVADADGYGPVALVKSKEPIMSPSWSPDGRQIAFVSFEKNRAEIYLIEVATGKRRLLSKFPGINGAPAWSPNGRQLAVVLSKEGSPKIFLWDMDTQNITQITDGYSIDTEPAWSKDGRSLYFTSNRGGKPQIYCMDMSTRKINRVTFVGNYNARPMLTSDGKYLVMMHREEGQRQFHIASQDLATGEVSVLTHAFLDESPTLSPNGAMVLYGTQEGDRQILSLVTLDGRGQLRLPAREGSVQEPAWSPFLS
ncbi:Tol-Pal system beta propeller repeat protein TolB [Candidatus Berkiella aquae]|uniref:Tol-Pal system beta propeller repeat protein TolB n=1 Tax=Candidatus Berkiella aquae TaxID=295108 RepID=UPI0035C900C6